jgi:hypothetical protein
VRNAGDQGHHAGGRPAELEKNSKAAELCTV